MNGDGVQYKIVELMTVTDETVGSAINEMIAAGWMFEDIKFAMREASKRPSMAFLFFTQPRSSNKSQDGPALTPRPATSAKEESEG